MHEISSMTYLCTEEEALRDLEENLRVLRERLRSSIKSDHGLFLTSTGSTVCPKKKETSKPTKYRKLPLRRKKRTRQQAVHLQSWKRQKKPVSVHQEHLLPFLLSLVMKLMAHLQRRSALASHKWQFFCEAPTPSCHGPRTRSTTKYNKDSYETTFEAVISKTPPPSQNPRTSSISLNMAPIVIDDNSPDPEKWISYRNDELDTDIQLYMVSKVNTLQTSAWLSDTEIQAGQQLLKEQFPFVDGLRYPSIVGELITPCKSAFVQIMNTGGHWVCISTVGCPPGLIKIYDSTNTRPSPKAVEHGCRMLFYPGKEITFSNQRVQQQIGGNDCGLFALAFATSLCNGEDPTQQTYDQSSLRSHYIECLETWRCLPSLWQHKKFHYFQKFLQRPIVYIAPAGRLEKAMLSAKSAINAIIRTVPMFQKELLELEMMDMPSL